MTVPCCRPIGTAGLFDCIQASSKEGCEAFHQDARAGPEGVECSPDGCWDCNRTPQPGPDFSEDGFGCCYDGTVWLFDSRARRNCLECGGVYARRFDCQEDIPPPECRLPEPDRAPPSGKRWTLDLLGTVAFGLPDVLSDGIARPTTDHLTRPIGPELGEQEPCAHLQAIDVMLDDGYVYVEACSQPVATDPRSQRVSYAAVMTADGVDRLQDGYQYDVGSIHLPYWTEAIVRSTQWRCQGPPV